MNTRPKRRKSNDNPYTLIVSNNIYAVIFKDSQLKEQKIEVTKEIFDLFDSFELDDISQMHKFDRHIEHSELTDESINRRAFNKSLSIEEEIIKKNTFDELKKAIDELSEVQKRRIQMYFFDNMKLEEISKVEGVSVKNIWKSINIALANLQKSLKK
ncbi:MAG: sigma-70 family RNA polymerase sigma factor [Bacilli bacterium]|nr:sigma-70 family RNA polymerase sigma factor [Bacilli bacterium]